MLPGVPNATHGVAQHVSTRLLGGPAQVLEKHMLAMSLTGEENRWFSGLDLCRQFYVFRTSSIKQLFHMAVATQERFTPTVSEKVILALSHSP